MHEQNGNRLINDDSIQFILFIHKILCRCKNVDTGFMDSGASKIKTNYHKLSGWT